MSSRLEPSPRPKQASQLVIAIDGPSAAGKSTISRVLARRLGLLFINTGAMYRAVALGAKRQAIDFSSAEALTRLAEGAGIDLRGDPDDTRVLLDGEDVTEAIRTPEISRLSSVVSTVPGVRRAMVAAQRRMGSGHGVVLEGRDIGTHVFPEADFKFFLVAEPEIRARRRWEEERGAGHQLTLEELTQEIAERDLRDANRTDSPLRRAEDAIIIDSSRLDVAEVVARILEVIQRAGYSP